MYIKLSFFSCLKPLYGIYIDLTACKGILIDNTTICITQWFRFGFMVFNATFNNISVTLYIMDLECQGPIIHI